MLTVKRLYFDVVLREDRSNLLYFFNRYVNVVSFLEDELCELHKEELPVEVLEELDNTLDDLVGKLDQVVAHGLHLLARVGHCVPLRLHLALHAVVCCKCLPGLQVSIREEECLTLNRLHKDVHLLQDELPLVDSFQEGFYLFAELFESADAID